MKPNTLKPGDKVAIVSLSSGILGESFVAHEVEIGVKRLKEYGLEPVFMKYSTKGIKYIAKHPKQRAKDLKQAFYDKDIKGIICAIGGTETYKIAPYLFEDKKFVKYVKENPKLFTGYSDSTINHLMLNRLGLNTFYGPNFLTDICELDSEMLPYTKMWFETYLGKKQKQITSSDVWYYEGRDYSPAGIGVPRKQEDEKYGFETLQGKGKKKGRLFGGCLDSLHDLVFGITERQEICKKYNLLPTQEQLKDAILFLETSDEKITPDVFEKMLRDFDGINFFDNISGIIVGKPVDNEYYVEYKQALVKVLGDKKTPILFNVNFGHSFPKCVIPYNILCEVDYTNKTIKFLEDLFND